MRGYMFLKASFHPLTYCKCHLNDTHVTTRIKCLKIRLSMGIICDKCGTECKGHLPCKSQSVTVLYIVLEVIGVVVMIFDGRRNAL